MPSFSELVLEISKKYWKDLVGQYPDKLYHYTDLSGLLGIIDTKGFWATNYQFLNDKEEIIYGKKRCQKILEEMKNQPLKAEQKQFLADLWKSIQLDDQDVFSVSFCSKPDLLSQWRGYSQGTTGVSIGFQLKELINYSTPRNDEYFYIRKVIYDEEIQDKILIDIINAGLEYLQENPYRGGFFLVEDISRTIKWFISIFKVKSFEEESEWRFTTTNFKDNGPGHLVRYRTRGNFILPYVELSLKYRQTEKVNLPIEEIFVGPPSNSLTLNSIEYMLKGKGYTNVKLLESGIPFR